MAWFRTEIKAGWNDATKLAVWNDCRACPNFSSAEWRYDRYGAPMKWDEYGNRSSEHGWEIAHIVPPLEGGNDDLGNLQALHWSNNAFKSEEHLRQCEVNFSKPLNQKNK